MTITTTFSRDRSVDPQLSTLKAGVVGLGFIGEVHVRAIRAAGGIVHSVAAVSLEQAQAAAVKLGVINALTIEEMVVHPEIDVIHVCTPNVFHAEMVELAITNGKHVICEKPLAISVEQAEHLVELAKKYGVVASIPFIYRYYPSILEAKNRISAMTEPLNLLHGYYLQDWLSQETTVNWRIDPKLGGPSRAFGDIGVHWCDLLEFVTGHRIIRLNAHLMRVFNNRGNVEKISTEDGATIIFETDKGACGSLVLSQVSPGNKNKLWFSFEGANESFVFDQESPDSLRIGGIDSNQIVMRGAPTESSDAGKYSILPAGHPQGYQDCFNAFVSDSYRKIAGYEINELPTFTDGLRATRLTEAVLESADKREWVDIK